MSIYVDGFIYFDFKIIYNDFGGNVKYSELSFREKVGQRFIIGINSFNIDVIIYLIKNYYIGGVILYKKNYNSLDEMIDVINRLKSANRENKIPLFIAIDQEGGRVNRLPDEIHNIKNIYDMSKSDNNLIYLNGVITGDILFSMGINMNFSPVLDIYNDGTVLSKRCFYGDVSDINSVSMNYVKGLEEKRVIAVCKHFPGHGVTRYDSHFISPYVFNYKDILNKHIKTFEYVINEGISAIMVSHLVIRKLTKGLPSSISNYFIKNYLRDRYNFLGVVISDEINMIRNNFLSKRYLVKKLINSGCDITLVKVKNNDCNILDKYIKMVSNNKDYMYELDKSVERIIKLKEKFNVNDNLVSKIDIDGFNKKIDELNEKCDKCI